MISRARLEEGIASMHARFSINGLPQTQTILKGLCFGSTLTFSSFYFNNNVAGTALPLKIAVKRLGRLNSINFTLRSLYKPLKSCLYDILCAMRYILSALTKDVSQSHRPLSCLTLIVPRGFLLCVYICMYLRK